MNEHPILMCGEMIRAYQAGRKWQARRVIKPQPTNYTNMEVHPNHTAKYDKPYFDSYRNGNKSELNPSRISEHWCWWTRDNRQGPDWIKCPYGQPGHQLWFKETFAEVPAPSEGLKCRIIEGRGITYRADWRGNPSGFKWKPSIFMPRWASRYTPKILNIRVQRVQEISEEDALAEGIRSFTKDGELMKYWPCDPCEGGLKCAWQDLPRSAVRAYQVLWDIINGKTYPWSSNPWVWVIEFEKFQ